MPVDPVGMWGIPTASIDWCEQNYVVTPWVAEFWNTLSSLAMVLAGVVGLCSRRFAREVRVAFALLVLVGVGSIAFHATLRFGLQMLDELPMLYLVTWLTWLLVENGPTRRSGRWFPVALGIYVLLATAGATLNRGDAQFLAFHVSFGAMEMACLARVTQLALRPENRTVRSRFAVGLLAYAGGIAVWFVDLKRCPWVSVTLPSHGIPNPQLHAWWHVLVSIGFFLLLGVVSFDRLRSTDRRAVP
ncbi:MAG TPA: ceramidase [Myxococcaceae bacterium]|nr:ceramidase [Myxococcaceae bacterium]